MRRAAGIALLCCATWAEASAADKRSAMLDHYRRQIDASLEFAHWSPQSVDRDGLLRELEKRIQAGESPERLSGWLQKEVPARWSAFAPVEPAHPSDAPLQLPFDNRINWIVGQGVASGYGHTGLGEHSLDFAMPEGTPILAARGGTVARVVDGFTRCCLPVERAHEANLVNVLHDDGTFASYVHLRRGIPVKEGQPIREHELVGYSGSTGYATMPHLHFAVSVRNASNEPRTIPIRFDNGTPEGYLPKQWRFYQNRPPMTAGVGAAIDGRGLHSGRPVLLERRIPVQLFVALKGPKGEPIDITRDPGTRYVAVTPWSLRIDPGGRVVFGFQSSQWAPLPEYLRTGLAIVTILYEGPDGREGAFDAWFQFADTQRRLQQKPVTAPPAPAH